MSEDLGTHDVVGGGVAGISLAGELAAGARALLPAVLPGQTIATDRDWERFVRTPLTPSQLLLTSYHPLGTCRMSPDPSAGVVDLDHAAHDLPGLFIVDGSTVPGPPSVNPQITIMALATRAAERIAARLPGGPPAAGRSSARATVPAAG